MEFIERLRKNAYSGLSVADHTIDLHGWVQEGFEKTFQTALIPAKESPVIIVEVGTWKGLSTSIMARTLKEMRKEAYIICIDTWLGAPEFWTWGIDKPEWGNSLKLRNGYPTVFETFTKNMKMLGMDDIVVPLPVSSLVGADILKHYGIKADLIYVDAAHEYESVKQDILKFKEILKPGGTIFGDDYSDFWAGVKKAVDETLPERIVEGKVWHSKID